MKNNSAICCHGVRTHNLKNLQVEIPLKKWIAVTGVSGSGKSSLVFDTIYAESQRRFLETLGTYERQFLQGLPQGVFDNIDNLPASVALKQSNKTGDPRSVIATVADIADPMRTLFMSFMESACSLCGNAVKIHQPKNLIDSISTKNMEKTEFYIAVPFQIPKEKSKQKKILQDLLIEGYVRIFYEGNIVNLEDAIQSELPQNIEIILDRIHSNIQPDELINRIETIWSQIKFSSRFSFVFLRQNLNETHPNIFHIQAFCETCNQKTTPIQTSDLDWQSILGSCETCHGLGNTPILDENKIVPNPNLSLEKGAIKPWNSDTFLWIKDELVRECKKLGIDTKTAYADLSEKEKFFIWNGEENSRSKSPKKNIKTFVPIQHFFQVLEEERYKSTSRILLAKYRKYVLCPTCFGSRIGKIGRNAICFEKKFHELFQCEISETYEWLQKIPSFKNIGKKLEAIQEIYDELLKKVSLLVKLGLGSAQLFRRCKTLSGGEYQRVLLTRVIGNGLTDALYVLDEPSVGLGKNEIPQLIECLQQLRDLGNTVLMVEHDKSLILAADEIIELGPKGGEEGGHLIKVNKHMPNSAISDFIPKQKIKNPSGKYETIELKNFSAQNCHHLNVEVYMHKLNVITGASGAGKSTLMASGFQAALEKLEEIKISSNSEPDDDNDIGIWDKIKTPPQFFEKNELVIVEQKALHRTITSVPATLLKLMDPLRKNFAQTSQAKELGYTQSDFSFNGGGGCETCSGKGVVQDDLFFLGQVEKVCPDCEGTRYRKEILNITYKDKNIHQWLTLTLEECLRFLGKENYFGKTLYLACELGLGHISLGTPTSTLSGGEAQRLRICAALCKSTKKLFCLLDEPTRGLSEKDVGHLLQCVLRFTRDGHTFVVVEHHDMFVDNADYLIKMGPGSGSRGGKIVEKFIEFNC